MTPYDLRAFKFRMKCTACGNHGPWAIDHLNNGTIRDGLPSIKPQRDNQQNCTDHQNNGNHNRSQNNNQQNGGQDDNNQNILTFTCTLSCSTSSACSHIASGPLFDDGTPFSVI